MNDLVKKGFVGLGPTGGTIEVAVQTIAECEINVQKSFRCILCPLVKTHIVTLGVFRLFFSFTHSQLKFVFFFVRDVFSVTEIMLKVFHCKSFYLYFAVVNWRTWKKFYAAGDVEGLMFWRKESDMILQQREERRTFWESLRKSRGDCNIKYTSLSTFH